MKNIIIITYGVIVGFLIVLGFDMEVARQDYIKAKENGDYEQKIEGCIFDFVCNRYTKELWEK